MKMTLRKSFSYIMIVFLMDKEIVGIRIVEELQSLFD